MTTLAEHVENYLTVRRALGFKLVGEERLLAEFVACAEAAGQPTVTTEFALQWARRPANAAATTICRGGCGRSARSRGTCTRSTPRARSRRSSCCPPRSTGRRHTSIATRRSSR